MNRKKNELDERKVKIYDLLSNVFIRFIYAIASLVAFFIVLYFLLTAQNDFDLKKYGIIEAFLAATVFLVWKYYFKKKN